MTRMTLFPHVRPSMCVTGVWIDSNLGNSANGVHVHTKNNSSFEFENRVLLGGLAWEKFKTTKSAD